MKKKLRYWRKVWIALILGLIPFQVWYPLYRRAQWRYGGLGKWNPQTHFDRFQRIFDLKILHPKDFDGVAVIELGTGGSLFHPILFYIFGFKVVHTIDVVDLKDFRLVARGMQFINNTKDQILQNLSFEFRADAEFRIDRLAQCTTIEEVCTLCNINSIVSSSIDVSLKQISESSDEGYKYFLFSSDVLEHVTSDFFPQFFNGILEFDNKSFWFYHYIDLGDHFYHDRDDELALNFLKLSDWFWRLLSLNRYQYCNRLRPDFYIGHFSMYSNAESVKYHIYRLGKHVELLCQNDAQKLSKSRLNDAAHGLEIWKGVANK